MRGHVWSVAIVTLLAGACRSTPEPTPAPPVPEPQTVTSPVLPDPAESVVDLDAVVREAAIELVKNSYPPLSEHAPVVVMPADLKGGGVPELGYLLADKLTMYLFNDAGCRIVDRQDMEKILQEKWGYADITNLDDVTQAGLAQGARFIATGTQYVTREKVEVTLRLLAVRDHGLISATSFSIPITPEVRDLLRLVRRPATGGGVLPPLTLDYKFELKNGKELTDGSRVRSREEFRIRLRANSDCYAYVLLLGSSGSAQPIFPHPDLPEDNRLKGNVEHIIPPPSHEFPFYHFDDISGSEEFYVFATYEEHDFRHLVRELGRTGAIRAGDLEDTFTGFKNRMDRPSQGAVRLKGGLFQVSADGKGVVLGDGHGPRHGPVKLPQDESAKIPGFITAAQRFTVQHLP